MPISRELHKRIKLAAREIEEGTGHAVKALRLVFYKEGSDSVQYIDAIGEFKVDVMFQKSGAVRKYVVDFVNEQPLPHNVSVEKVFFAYR